MIYEPASKIQLGAEHKWDGNITTSNQLVCTVASTQMMCVIQPSLSCHFINLPDCWYFCIWNYKAAEKTAKRLWCANSNTCSSAAKHKIICCTHRHLKYSSVTLMLFERNMCVSSQNVKLHCFPYLNTLLGSSERHYWGYSFNWIIYICNMTGTGCSGYIIKIADDSSPASEEGKKQHFSWTLVCLLTSVILRTPSITSATCISPLLPLVRTV